MDETGMTVVRTPHAVSTWNKAGRQGFRNRGKRKRQEANDDQYRCPGTTGPTMEVAAAEEGGMAVPAGQRGWGRRPAKTDCLAQASSGR